MAKNVRKKMYRRFYPRHEFISLSQLRSSFAFCLSCARFSHNHSQSDLAQMLGTRQANISDWENAKSLPSFYQYLLLEHLYGRAYFTSLYDENK